MSFGRLFRSSDFCPGTTLNTSRISLIVNGRLAMPQNWRVFMACCALFRMLIRRNLQSSSSDSPRGRCSRASSIPLSLSRAQISSIVRRVQRNLKDEKLVSYIPDAVKNTTPQCHYAGSSVFKKEGPVPTAYKHISEG